MSGRNVGTMPVHPTAPEPSSDVLKARVANFMRRANAVLAHPLTGSDPRLSMTLAPDPDTGEPTRATFSYENIPQPDLIYLATLMRPVIFLNDPVNVLKLTSRVEAEHAAFRGKFQDLRKAFADWLRTPIVTTWTIGCAPPQLQSDEPQIMFGPDDPSRRLPDGIVLTDPMSDMVSALNYFYGQVWHSDDDKTQAFEDASDERRQFMAKCAEIRTLGAVQFIRPLHTWVREVRAMGMDI